MMFLACLNHSRILPKTLELRVACLDSHIPMFQISIWTKARATYQLADSRIKTHPSVRS